MKRALLVEDARSSARIAESVLRACGFDPIVHRTSVKGAKAACVAKFALCLVDVGVRATEIGGDASGLDFVRWLRRLRPDARVIIWSANDCEAEARRLDADFVRKDDDVVVKLKEAVMRAR